MNCEEHTLEAVAQIFGVTRERIRQIQAWCEKKLKFLLIPFHDHPLVREEVINEVATDSAIHDEEPKSEELLATPNIESPTPNSGH